MGARRILILLCCTLASGKIIATPVTPRCERVFLASKASENLAILEAIERHLFIFSVDEKTLSAELKSAADQKYLDLIHGLYRLKTASVRTVGLLEEFLAAYVRFHLPNLDSEIQRLGLSHAELFAIRSYTGEDYRVINQALRSQEGAASELEPLFKVLDRALSKAPRYEGWVKRGTSLPEDIAELHQVGQVITYPAYTSASAGFVYPGKYQFKILSLYGRNVDFLSQNKGEGEVLFGRNSQFEVLSRERVGDEVHIVMVELDTLR